MRTGIEISMTFNKTIIDNQFAFIRDGKHDKSCQNKLKLLFRSIEGWQSETKSKQVQSLIVAKCELWLAKCGGGNNV